MADIPEPQFNAADQKQVKERERKGKIDRKQEITDLRAVLAMPEGRRFLWRFMGACGVEESSFNANAALMAKACGMRDAGQMLKAKIIEADERAYLTMMQESFNP